MRGGWEVRMEEGWRGIKKGGNCQKSNRGIVLHIQHVKTIYLQDLIKINIQNQSE